VKITKGEVFPIGHREMEAVELLLDLLVMLTGIGNLFFEIDN
jgi:hypothetical protein